MLKNMKLATKLAGGFALVVAVVVVLGALAYVMFTRVNGNVSELNQHVLPAVQHSTGVERTAFETILEERNYLLQQKEETHQQAKEKLTGLYGNLDKVDKVAEQFRNAGLGDKSKEVRRVVTQYGQLFEQGVQVLKSNKDAETAMNTRGEAVGGEADAYMAAKKTQYLEDKNALAIVNTINALALETRMNEKGYMLYKEQKYFDVLAAGIAKLLKCYDELEKLHPDATEAKQIIDARKATQEYLEAAQAWMTEQKKDDKSAHLAQLVTKMVEAGETVGKAAADYLAAKQIKVDKTAEAVFIVSAIDQTSAGVSAIVGTSKMIIVVTLLVGALVAFVAAFFITRGITGPLNSVVGFLNTIAQGDVSQSVPTGLVGRQDEIGILGQAAGKMTDSLRHMLNDISESVRTLASSSTELSAISGQMAGGAKEMSEKATTVAASAEEISANTTSVAAGMGQATNSLTTVATATEEMTATISEIAGKSEKGPRHHHRSRPAGRECLDAHAWPRGGRAGDWQSDRNDHQHLRPDQPPGPQRHHRSGAGRCGGQGVRRRGQRDQGTGPADRHRHGGYQEQDRQRAGIHFGYGAGYREDHAGDQGGERYRDGHRHGNRGAVHGHQGHCQQRRPDLHRG